MATKEQLLAVGPIDGRYADKVKSLRYITSEHGLIQRRVAVEAGWLSMLGSGILTDREPLSESAHRTLEMLPKRIRVSDSMRIKDIEKSTNHDVKAVEVWLRMRLAEDPAFKDYLELIHFGRTSEDINNLAYAMMIRDARDDVIIPSIEAVTDDLSGKAEEYANMSMLAHTHGQPATPTTMGKEMAVFSQRLKLSSDQLASVAILGKLNGASGNYNADAFAYPEIRWPVVAKDFVKRLGFEFNPVTTQIEPHDWTVRFANELALNNSIMTDLARDMWTYISMHYFTQEAKAGETGSSTMPHKVNPIDFENAESNFDTAINLLQGLARKLPISRLQRDLSDSSSLRTLGEAFGHAVIAHNSMQKGLGKVHPDPHQMTKDLREEWGVLTEPIQTVMRRYGITGAYDAMKAASRGKALTRADYLALVDAIEDLPKEEKARLRKLTPAKYIGLASQIALGIELE